MSSKISLKTFKSLIRDGAVYTCVENTFKPELNGQERIITKAQTNGWFWVLALDTDDQPKRFWTDMPTAADILESHSNGFGLVTVKFRTRVEGMTLYARIRGAVMSTERLQDRIDDSAYRIKVSLGAAIHHGRLPDDHSQRFAGMMLNAAKWWAGRAWRMAVQLETGKEQ
jgi:hypothetical protein